MADVGRWKPYVQRQAQLLPAFVVKQAMGFRRCQLRDRVKVWGEWNLAAAACNLRRLFARGVAPA